MMDEPTCAPGFCPSCSGPLPYHVHGCPADTRVPNARHDEEETADLLEQRDALADALEKHLFAQYGKTAVEIAEGWEVYCDSLSFAAAGPSIAALRKAGRLPK